MSMRRDLVFVSLFLALGACAPATPPVRVAVTPAAATPPPGKYDLSADPATPSASLPPSRRSLESFAKSNQNPQCFDRKTESYTPVVDVHFHPRPSVGRRCPRRSYSRT
ncbi:MAG: hypothetical protein ABI616_02195 [Pseudomonadota bacterium]